MTENRSNWSPLRRQNIAMWAALAIILYILVTEHWAHVVPYLPWLILLACPLLHVFMNGGHGHGGHGHDDHDHDNGRNRGGN